MAQSPIRSADEATLPHHPITTLSARLTRADALAWLALPREMVGWRRLAFLVWLGLGGVTLAVIETVGAAQSGWRFWAALLAAIAVQWGLAALWMTLRRHIHARRMVPAPVAQQVEVWGDHLAVLSGTRRFHIAPETIRQLVTTHTHVFIEAPPEVLILPLAAFADAADMQAFAATWDALSHSAAP